MPARLGQLVVLAALHPLLNLIEIIDQFALFLLQALEFALDAFALGLVLGVEQGNLQFLHPLIQVRLPPGQFLEAVERLQLLGALALLPGLLLLPLGLALQLVVVARILHLKLVELALGTVAVAAAPLPGLLLGLLAGDAKLILAQFLQVLQGGLLLDDRPGKRLAKRIAAGVPRLRQAVGGGLHRLVGLVRLATGLGVLQQRRRLLEQADQFLLRIEHDPNVVGQFFVVGIAALQVPCGADDLFLRVEHVGDGLLLFAALLAALTLLLLLPHALGSGTVLPEDFLERPYGGEI